MAGTDGFYPSDCEQTAVSTTESVAGPVGTTQLACLAADDALAGGVRVYTPLGYRIAFAIATAAGAISFCCAIWLYRHERTAYRTSRGT